jgi:hypothetical protein
MYQAFLRKRSVVDAAFSLGVDAEAVAVLIALPALLRKLFALLKNQSRRRRRARKGHKVRFDRALRIEVPRAKDNRIEVGLMAVLESDGLVRETDNLRMQ